MKMKKIELRVGSARPKFYYVDLLLILYTRSGFHSISGSNLGGARDTRVFSINCFEFHADF